MGIDKLRASDNPLDASNSKGKEIVRAINSIVHLTMASSEPEPLPPVDPSVNVYASLVPDIAYSFGDEIRTSFAFFRCIRDIPEGVPTVLYDTNHWRIFWMPDQPLGAFRGIYNQANHYHIGDVVLMETIDDIRVMKVMAELLADTPFAESNFQLLQTIMR